MKTLILFNNFILFKNWNIRWEKWILTLNTLFVWQQVANKDVFNLNISILKYNIKILNIFIYFGNYGCNYCFTYHYSVLIFIIKNWNFFPLITLKLIQFCHPMSASWKQKVHIMKIYCLNVIFRCFWKILITLKIINILKSVKSHFESMSS